MKIAPKKIQSPLSESPEPGGGSDRFETKPRQIDSKRTQFYAVWRPNSGREAMIRHNPKRESTQDRGDAVGAP